MGESGEAGPERDPQLKAQGWAAGDPAALLQGEPPGAPSFGDSWAPAAARSRVAVLRLSWGG